MYIIFYIPTRIIRTYIIIIIILIIYIIRVRVYRRRRGIPEQPYNYRRHSKPSVFSLLSALGAHVAWAWPNTPASLPSYTHTHTILHTYYRYRLYTHKRTNTHTRIRKQLGHSTDTTTIV